MQETILEALGDQFLKEQEEAAMAEVGPVEPGEQGEEEGKGEEGFREGGEGEGEDEELGDLEGPLSRQLQVRAILLFLLGSNPKLPCSCRLWQES